MGVAYLDFPTREAPLARMRSRTTERPADGLNDRERGALMLAKTDGRTTLRSLGRLGRLSQICFGLPRRLNTLADPRLEGLRRYAVALAHDMEEAVLREREHLIDLGFSHHQILAAEATVIRFERKGARTLLPRTLSIFVRSVLGSSQAVTNPGYLPN